MTKKTITILIVTAAVAFMISTISVQIVTNYSYDLYTLCEYIKDENMLLYPGNKIPDGIEEIHDMRTLISTYHDYKEVCMANTDVTELREDDYGILFSKYRLDEQALEDTSVFLQSFVSNELKSNSDFFSKGEYEKSVLIDDSYSGFMGFLYNHSGFMGFLYNHFDMMTIAIIPIVCAVVCVLLLIYTVIVFFKSDKNEVRTGYYTSYENC